MNLPNKPKSKENAVLLHYTHEIIFLCLHSMKLFWKNGVIYIDVNFLLGIERRATLKKWLDSINPFIPIRLIEMINTNTLEAIYPRLLQRVCDDSNESEDKLVLINESNVDVLHFALESKGIC